MEEGSLVVGGGSRRREEDEDAGLIDEADAVAPLLDERGMVVWCGVVVGRQRGSASLVAESDDEESGLRGWAGPGLRPGCTRLSSVRICVCVACVRELQLL